MRGCLAIAVIRGGLVAMLQAFELVEEVGIVDGRRDDVAAGGPLAKIEDAAAIGAERESPDYRRGQPCGRWGRRGLWVLFPLLRFPLVEKQLQGSGRR